MWMNILTAVSCFAIVYIAYKYYMPLRRLTSFVKSWANSQNINDIEASFDGMKQINADYKDTVILEISDTIKTTTHAEEFYYRRNIARVIGVNLKAISSAPGLISGLGVLGTFIGLTISVALFKSNNSEEIMNSIQTLLGGMGTAFLTSVFGMTLSSLYIWKQKKVYNDLDIVTSKWCKVLDDKYYVSEIDLLRRENMRQQNEMMESLKAIHEANEKQLKAYEQSIDNLKQQEESHQQALMDALIGYDESGEAIRPGDMLQNLYEESEKQSQALESFTTDLSNELNASLGNTMNASIVPLIQDLERSHQVFNSKLDSLSENMKSTATDMVSSVVSELQSSMQQMTNEFKDSISNDTMSQMDVLAANLTKSSEVLNGIPQTMELMTKSVTDNFNNVKSIIGQLQTSVEDQQSQMVEKARTVNEDMATQMKTKLDEMMSTITASVTKLNEQQSGLIDGQGRSTREIARLLVAFDESIRKMKTSNLETSQLLVNVQKVGENLDTSAGKIKELSEIMKDVSDTLISQQKENIQKYKEIQQANQDTVDDINQTLKTTQQLISDYTAQYGIIHEGLKDIFAEISKGLQDYSTTLSKNTGEALGLYSNALEKSTKGLQNIAEALNDSAEELTDGVDKLKMRIR